MVSHLRILYLVYWGAAEPLGQSLVLPSVRELARRGAELTLVTFEKPADLSRSANVESIRTALSSVGVRWLPLRYHKRPKLPATALDLAAGFLQCLRLHLANRFHAIHARTFVAGTIGLLLAPLLRIPLVYHNEGFYPDEQVDAGVWKQNSALYRLARRIEDGLYSRADGLLVLSEKSACELREWLDAKGKRTPVVVAHSSVDLDLFPAPASGSPAAESPLRLVYMGNVEGRYDFEAVARFAATAAQEPPGADLLVLTYADPAIIQAKAAAAGLPADHLRIAAVTYRDVPQYLGERHAGIHFLPRGRSEHAGSPVKIGEYWACGLPVVVTPNIGDSDHVIEREGVGVIVPDHSDTAHLSALRRLRGLLAQPEIRDRCRRAAEGHHALSPICDAQIALYHQLVRSAGRQAKRVPP